MATPSYKKDRICCSCGKQIHSRYSRCNDCINAASREIRKKDLERIKSVAKAWRVRNPDKMRAIHRRRSLRDNYGIDVDDYQAIFIKQEGKCAICRTDVPGGPCKRNFMVGRFYH